jgi:hypothetical protein
LYARPYTKGATDYDGIELEEVCVDDVLSRQSWNEVAVAVSSVVGPHR